MTDETNGAEANPASAETTSHVTTADIADFDTISACEKGADMEVRNPATGEVLRHDPQSGEAIGRPFTITFKGSDSKTFQDKAFDNQDRRLATQMRTRSATLSRVAVKDDIEVLVAATLQWDIVLGKMPDGTPRIPPSNSNEYRAAYTKYPWLKRQADEFTGNVGNFIKSAQTS
jgi:hypothetical protein